MTRLILKYFFATMSVLFPAFMSATTTADIRGDVNSDGTVDISDVLATVDYILGKPVDKFDKNKADLNNDSSIDISDVLLMVDIILGKPITDPQNPSLPVDHPQGGDPGDGV